MKPLRYDGKPNPPVPRYPSPAKGTAANLPSDLRDAACAASEKQGEAAIDVEIQRQAKP